jgi:hypothetical protein
VEKETDELLRRRENWEKISRERDQEVLALAICFTHKISIASLSLF